MASTPGFEPGPHWWEASALTTAPPLLPRLDVQNNYVCVPWENNNKKTKNSNLFPQHLMSAHIIIVFDSTANSRRNYRY